MIRAGICTDFNWARTSRKPYMIVCEGYMDVISLHQAGFTNAVASLGTALTAGHAALIKRYTNEVYLTYDSDEAGTESGTPGNSDPEGGRCRRPA